MNGFCLACDVLQVFTTISKLLEAETKLKLTYIIHLQAFSIKLDYVISPKYHVYIFLSHTFLHIMCKNYFVVF